MKEICNPIEEVRTNIPELADIEDNEQNCKRVSYENWDNRLKTISTKNLRKYKSAVTISGLEVYFQPCIVCVHPDDREIEINLEKYRLIRRYVMSEEHHV